MLIGCLALVLLCSGYGGGSEVTRGGDQRMATGNWSVDGIEIGSSYQDLESLLGPSEQRTFNQTPAYAFSGGTIIVTFDSAGQVQRVAGQRLLRNGQAVLTVGEAKQSIGSTLGRGYVIERYSTKAVGIFTAGSVPLWTENYYHDGANRFLVVTDRRDVISSIQFAPLEKSPLPEN